MPTVRWQTTYDNKEPRSEEEEMRDRMIALRWELDVDPESNYTLEELEEMMAAEVYDEG